MAAGGGGGAQLDTMAGSGVSFPAPAAAAASAGAVTAGAGAGMMAAGGGSGEVYCVCRTSDVTGTMLECDFCQDWFHVSCGERAREVFVFLGGFPDGAVSLMARAYVLYVEGDWLGLCLNYY